MVRIILRLLIDQSFKVVIAGQAIVVIGGTFILNSQTKIAGNYITAFHIRLVEETIWYISYAFNIIFQ